MKIIYFFLFSSIAILLIVPNSQSATYTTFQSPVKLTDTEYSIPNFSTGNNNHIAWIEDDKIFLFDGSSTKHIADTFLSEVDFNVNDSGHIVWGSSSAVPDRDSEIFLYDGSDIIQLNYISTTGYSPQINNNDTVVWWGLDGNDSEIFIYDGQNTIQLTQNNTADTDPQINNNGWILWSDNWRFYLYNGETITTFPDSENWYDDPQLNDNDEVVYVKDDGGGGGIFLYNGNDTYQLTDKDLYPYSYGLQINNSGCAVWRGWVGGVGYEVFYYDGSEINRISKNYSSSYSYGPRITNNGYIAWLVNSGDKVEVFLYNGHNTYQITDSNFDYIKDVQINDDGLLVWLGSGIEEIGYEVYYTYIQSGDGSNQDDTGLSLPNLIQPVDKSEVTTLTPTLIAEIPPNAVENALPYEFQIDVTKSFDTKNIIVSPDIVTEKNGTASWRPGTLKDNTLYYWRLRASDEITQNVWALGSFFVNLENEAPSAPGTTNPDEREILSLDRNIYLRVTPSIDPEHEKLTYTYELYKDKYLKNQLCSGDSENPTWLIPIPLQFDTYYYRVCATDEHGLQGPWSLTTKLVIRQGEESSWLDDLMEGYDPYGAFGGCFINNLF